MPTIRVTATTRTPIAGAPQDQIRTLSQDFGSAKKAAEFACDLIYLLDGPSAANGHSDKDYTLSKNKTHVQYSRKDSSFSVSVAYLGTTYDRGTPGRTPAA